MVASSAGPGLIVLHRAGIHVGQQACGAVLEGHVAVSPVGVHAGVDEDHRTFQPCRNIAFAGITARHQRVHGAQGGLRADGLIAMDVVAQVDEGHPRIVRRKSVALRSGEVGLPE